MFTILSDLRLAWRRLARTPGQTLTTIAVVGARFRRPARVDPASVLRAE